MPKKDYSFEKDTFSYDELKSVYDQKGLFVSDRTLKYEIKKMIDEKKLARVGRNVYCVPKQKETIYEYEYSDFAKEIASYITAEYPFIKFSISELVQLNEFVNHQMGKNVLFLSVEWDGSDYVFESLKEKYLGKVLIAPSVEMFHKYWIEDMIVILKLVSEAPKGKKHFWNSELEKLLVDVFVEDLWKGSIAESELVNIYETAFEKYLIDESRLFRYARRRTSERKIKQFIEEKTNVKLRLG